MSGDILIHTGDILYNDEAGTNSIEELKSFDDWIKETPFKHKIVIAGNHDHTIEILGQEKAVKYLSHCNYLENESFSCCGINFYGCPASIGTSFNQAFQLSENSFNKLEFPPVDILLTHGITPTLKERVDEFYKPKLHIFGHYHHKNGIKLGKNTMFINTSTVGRFGLPINPIYVIDV